MPRRRTVSFTIACLICVFLRPPAGLYGQRLLSIGEALEAAREASVELRYAAALRNSRLSRLSPLITDHIPVLTLSYRGSNEYFADRDYERSHVLGLGGRIQLFDGGRSLLRRRSRILEGELLETDYEEIEEELRYRLIEGYCRCLAAEEEVERKKEAYRHASRNISLLRIELSHGRILREELSDSVLLQKRLALALRKATFALESAIRDFSLLTGNEEARPRGGIPKDYQSALLCRYPSPAPLIDSLRADSPGIRAAARGIEKQRIALQQHRRRFLPSASLFSVLSFDGPSFPPVNPELTFGVTIRIGGASSGSASSGSGTTGISYTASAVSRHYGGAGYDSLSAELPLYGQDSEKDVLRAALARARASQRHLSLSLEGQLRELYGEVQILDAELQLLRNRIYADEKKGEREALLYRRGELDLRSLFHSQTALDELHSALFSKTVELFLFEYRLLSLCGKHEEAERAAEEFFIPAENEVLR